MQSCLSRIVLYISGGRLNRCSVANYKTDTPRCRMAGSVAQPTFESTFASQLGAIRGLGESASALRTILILSGCEVRMFRTRIRS